MDNSHCDLLYFEAVSRGLGFRAEPGDACCYLLGLKKILTLHQRDKDSHVLLWFRPNTSVCAKCQHVLGFSCVELLGGL